jgi:hypothetical protein
MASGVNRTKKDVGYGLTNALQDLAAAPIVASRDTFPEDSTEIGGFWVNKLTNSVSVYSGTFDGINVWDGIANLPLTVNSFPALPTNAVGIFSGTGAPDFDAEQGSLYFQVNGNSNATRAWIATDNAGTWTNITTAA